MGRRRQVTLGARYTRTAIVLHWLVALLIAGMIGVGYYMTDLPRNTLERGWYFNLHKSFGLVAAMLIVARFAWRARHAPPAAAMRNRWQAMAARTNHALLYVCLLLMPLSGYLGSSFGKFGVKLFGFPLPHWGWEDKRLQDFFVSAHHTVAPILIALVSLHIAAALYHGWRRDGVLGRMWFRGAP